MVAGGERGEAKEAVVQSGREKTLFSFCLINMRLRHKLRGPLLKYVPVPGLGNFRRDGTWGPYVEKKTKVGRPRLATKPFSFWVIIVEFFCKLEDFPLSNSL